MNCSRWGFEPAVLLQRVLKKAESIVIRVISPPWKQDRKLTVINEHFGRSGSCKDGLQTQSVHEKQSQVEGTKSRLPVIAASEQYRAKHTHTHTHWQAFVIGNPNYNVFQSLLKLLIITATNYCVPILRREEGTWGGDGERLQSQSVSDQAAREHQSKTSLRPPLRQETPEGAAGVTRRRDGI